MDENRTLIELMKRYKNFFLAEGIIFTLLGIFAMAVPQLFSLTLDYFLGWLFIFSAIALTVRMFKMPQMPNRTVSSLNALLYLALGLLLLVYPVSGILTIDLLLAGYFLFDGIMKIYGALQLRPVTNWGWIMTSGILSLILAVIILALWPTEAAWMLGMLVGINLFCTGVTTLGFLWGISER